MESKTKTKIGGEQIAALVAHAFGDVKPVEVTELTEGFFNAIYAIRLDGTVQGCQEIVLKLGVQAGKHILQYEQDIMPAELYVYGLLEKAGVPVPKILYADTSRALIDCDYFFMEKLTGDTWAHLMPRIAPENFAALQRELGRCTALLHSISADYFGYIKEDSSYRFPTWRQAFRSFIDRIVEDGVRDGVKLPYDEVYAALERYWPLLDEVKVPSLVNYDMWAKNIMLREENGLFVIDGFLDHERAFFGDPVAELISTQTICGDIAQAHAFREGYETVRPFVFGESEQVRLILYRLYMELLIGVEMYRYDIPDPQAFMEERSQSVRAVLAELQ